MRICLVGFGEVGQTLAADLWARDVHEVSAWDIQFPDPASAPSRALMNSEVRAGTDAHDAIAGAQLVISAVTAAQDIDAARSIAQCIDRNAIVLDLNSVSPGVKLAASGIVESVGGRYIEVAIMAPIAPKRLATPMLFGGPHAARFLPIALELGFRGAEFFSKELGRAAAAKMCRSIVVKGVEALLAESLLTARHYGVEDTVLESLHGLFPAQDWRSLARYMISRSLIHGRRRAEEMREVVRTVAEAGVDPWMSSASAQRQDWAAEHRDSATHERLETMLDSVIASLVRANGAAQ